MFDDLAVLHAKQIVKGVLGASDLTFGLREDEVPFGEDLVQMGVAKADALLLQPVQ